MCVWVCNVCVCVCVCVHSPVCLVAPSVWRFAPCRSVRSERWSWGSGIARGSESWAAAGPGTAATTRKIWRQKYSFSKPRLLSTNAFLFNEKILIYLFRTHLFSKLFKAALDNYLRVRLRLCEVDVKAVVEDQAILISVRFRLKLYLPVWGWCEAGPEVVPTCVRLIAWGWWGWGCSSLYYEPGPEYVPTCVRLIAWGWLGWGCCSCIPCSCTVGWPVGVCGGVVLRTKFVTTVCCAGVVGCVAWNIWRHNLFTKHFKFFM